jgi:alkylation response protein AidB-like acyl-CoA dehydrogenase
MDFNFSDDQEQLREAVSRWVDKGYDFERRKSIVTREGGFSAKAYAEMAELGLCGLMINSDHGGMDMGPVEAMVTMEALGAGLVLEPLAHTLMCSAIVQAYGEPALQSQYLPLMAEGSCLMVLAYQERGGRYQLSHCHTTATANGSGYTLTGAKHVVPAGAQANSLLVNAMLNGQMALFVLDTKADGVHAETYSTQDGSAAAEVVFDGAAAALVTTSGLTALEHAVDVGIALLCAQAVGVMDKTLTLTAEYLNTRKQFGVAIASFQALRHRLADMKMALELARSISYYATLKVNAPAPERRMAMARAKYQLGQSMRFVGQQSVQLHGGIGVTDEYVGSHYFKALTQMEMLFGDSNHHLGEVNARMQDTAGVFV